MVILPIMALLGVDVGSSSVKCAILNGSRIVGKTVTEPFQTRLVGNRAEVDAEGILRAIEKGLAVLGKPGGRAGRCEAIALTNMSPSWVAMDGRGNAITPIVTHQDRRSVEIAEQLESRIGKERHLRLVGNRPFPGGISSTTAGWFARHQSDVMKRADLVGHVSTFLHRRLTGERVVDPSNASFMGLFDVVGLSGWVAEMCESVGVRMDQLPRIVEGDRVAGRLTAEAAGRLGLPAGMPMLTGVVDGSAAMLLSGARAGQLMNVCGSTDVLALVTTTPVPHERLLTRSIGMGRKWLSVSTLAAAGSALQWAKEQLFAEMSWDQFSRLLKQTGKSGSAVAFTPYLGGDRMSVEQKRAEIRGLTLGSTRLDILAGMVEGLTRASAERLEHLRINPVRMRREVFVTGGASRVTGGIFQRDWPGKWTFRHEADATLRGLGTITPKE